MTSQTSHHIAVVGGTGPQGRGLAYRFARAGHTVSIGSRQAARAERTAAQVTERLTAGPGAGQVTGTSNEDACADADLVVLAVPYEGHDDLVASLPLAGRIVISCVNPLAFDERGAYGLLVDGGGGSAAESAQRLQPGAAVVGAFHHVAAASLWSDAEYLDEEDVLVVGDDAGAKQAGMALAATVTGRPGIDAGALRLARQLEPLTAVLISINSGYGTHSGIRIHGI
ncbi:NADPH-dependent F420 reductase [Nocardioidaceae bacterium]|nr:NADPH-dependent F420 reductase [Nocardioidaceae bacterium]